MPHMVEVRWLGCAGLEISIDGSVVLIDPYLSRPGKFSIFFRRLHPSHRKIRAYTARLTGKECTVICGHTHFDHALDIPDIVHTLGCKAVGSTGLKALMQASGRPEEVIVCRGNEVIGLSDGVEAHMIPSRHGLVFFGTAPYPGEIDPGAETPLKARQYRLGTMFMPKIRSGGITLIHAGSANFIESEIREHRCDILFMCVQGWKAVPDYTSRLVEILRPEVVIPIHFDDFTKPVLSSGKVRRMPMSDLPGFVERIRRHSPGAVIRIPGPNEIMRF